MRIFLLSIIMIITPALSQIRILTTESLPVPATQVWNAPRFSPDGDRLFLTSEDHHGIWQYSLSTRLLRQITNDRGAGFGYTISKDGNSLVYRTTVVPGDHRTRLQESVSLSLKNGERKVLHRGNSVELPRFINSTAVAVEKISDVSDAPITDKAPVSLLGTSDDGIRFIQNGNVVTIDPLGKGRYLWPQLSPDGKRIVAMEMDRGAFIADIDGKNVVRIGKCNAPQWSRSGLWVIGMDDKDDGHTLTGSEIIAVSVDGSQRVVLTSTPSVHEMYPAVSPTGDAIVAVTFDGSVLKLIYTEGE
jgi:Tol biopolymer transport system component